MSIVTSIYKEMNDEHLKMMNSSQEHLVNMLDYAIEELVEIARDNDIYLMDDLLICESYEDIFHCLKHRSQKRMEYNK